VNGDGYVLFKGAVATALMTIDTSALTGPGAPYSGYSVVGSVTWTVPTVTLAIGDLLDDVMWAQPTPFTNTATLALFDNGTASKPEVTTWETNAAPLSSTHLDDSPTFTKFYGGTNSSEADHTQTSLTGLQTAAAAANTGDPSVQRVPVVARQTVTIYAAVDGVDNPPTEGEVWVWVNVATPKVP
jgi:hypothetical protein